MNVGAKVRLLLVGFFLLFVGARLLLDPPSARRPFTDPPYGRHSRSGFLLGQLQGLPPVSCPAS